MPTLSFTKPGGAPLTNKSEKATVQVALQFRVLVLWSHLGVSDTAIKFLTGLDFLSKRYRDFLANVRIAKYITSKTRRSFLTQKGSLPTLGSN